MMRKRGISAADGILLFAVVGLILLFVAWPFVAVFREGLREAAENGGMAAGAMAWVRALADNGPLIGRSVLLGAWTTLLTTAGALCMTVLLFYARPVWRTRLEAVLLLALISPPFVGALSYVHLFGRRGLITWQVLGLATNPYGLPGMVLMQTLSFVPLATLLLLAAADQLDGRLFDAARSLGASTARQIGSVLLAGLRPAILVVLLLTFVRSLSDFGTPTIIGGRYTVLATEAYFSVIAAGDLAKATQLNFYLLLPSLLAFVVYLRSMRKSRVATQGRVPRAKLEGRGALLWGIRAVASLFFVWMIMQYTSVVVQAFGTWRAGSFEPSLEPWVKTLPYLRGSFLRSIVYSALSAAGATLLGFLLAYYSGIRKIRSLSAVDALATLPYILPGTFFGIGYILAFRAAPLALTGTAAIVVLNMLFKQLPFASKMGGAAVTTVDPLLHDAVRALGAHPLRSFDQVLVPLSARRMMLCFLQSFAAGMTTVGSIIFLIYPGQKVLTLEMFDVIQSGKYDVAAVLALLILLVCMSVNALGYWLTRERKIP